MDTPEDIATQPVTTPPGPRRIELSKGGHAVVELDMEMLTGAQAKRIRRALDLDGDGHVANTIHALAMLECIIEWNIPYRTGIDIPSRDTRGIALFDMLNMADLRALERAVEPLVRELTGQAMMTPVAAEGEGAPASA